MRAEGWNSWFSLRAARGGSFLLQNLRGEKRVRLKGGGGRQCPPPIIAWPGLGGGGERRGAWSSSWCHPVPLQHGDVRSRQWSRSRCGGRFKAHSRSSTWRHSATPIIPSSQLPPSLPKAVIPLLSPMEEPTALPPLPYPPLCVTPKASAAAPVFPGHSFCFPSTPGKNPAATTDTPREQQHSSPFAPCPKGSQLTRGLLLYCWLFPQRIRVPRAGCSPGGTQHPHCHLKSGQFAECSSYPHATNSTPTSWPKRTPPQFHLITHPRAVNTAKTA